MLKRITLLFLVQTTVVGFGVSKVYAVANVEIEMLASQISGSSNLIIPTEIDPIITGSSVSPEQEKLWKKRKRDYENCGLCEEIQPFPGDLPE